MYSALLNGMSGSSIFEDLHDHLDIVYNSKGTRSLFKSTARPHRKEILNYLGICENEKQLFTFRLFHLVIAT